MRTVLPWIAALATFTSASGALAEEIPRIFRLSLQGDDCITGESLREALSVALRHDPVDSSASATLEVEILAGASLGRAHFRFLSEKGQLLRERTHTVTGGCGVLLREVSLSIAVMYEAGSPPEPPACDAACRAQIRAEVHAELCKRHPRSCDVDGVIPVLLAGGALSLGLTADPGGGAWLGGEVRFGEVFSAALDARVVFPSRIVPTAGDSDELTMVTFGLSPCLRYKYLLGCASVDMGMFIASRLVALDGGPAIAATFGVGPRLAGQFPLSDRFGIRVFADLRFAPIRTELPVINTGGRWTSNIVSGLVGAGFTFQ